MWCNRRGMGPFLLTLLTLQVPHDSKTTWAMVSQKQKHGDTQQAECTHLLRNCTKHTPAIHQSTTKFSVYMQQHSMHTTTKPLPTKHQNKRNPCLRTLNTRHTTVEYDALKVSTLHYFQRRRASGSADCCPPPTRAIMQRTNGGGTLIPAL